MAILAAKLRTSSSHQEGCERQFALATKEFMGENGKVTAVKTCSLIWENGKYSEVEGSEKIYPADLVCCQWDSCRQLKALLQIFKWKRIVEETLRLVTTVWILTKQTEKMFCSRDVRRGQSLVVWAIREGRKAAEAINKFLSTPDFDPLYYISSSKGASTDPLHWFSF